MPRKEDIRLHAVIEGDVQGVGFRAFVQSEAVHLGLRGWVRNRWDGSVEVLAEGSKENLEILLQALYRGPQLSHVSSVWPDWEPASGEFVGFSVRSTSA